MVGIGGFSKRALIVGGLQSCNTGSLIGGLHMFGSAGLAVVLR